MKFNFKIQKYQTDAVNAVVNVFRGQSFNSNTSYMRDLGTLADNRRSQIDIYGETDDDDIYSDTGFKNAKIELTDEALLDNIHDIQKNANIRLSNGLTKDLGRVSLDIDMETGTGKTYVYIKTMFELNKVYGWNKFIVVVPSIAIREGVKKTFEMTEDHFMEHYGKKARYFVYDSKNLTDIDRFSADNGINVMIINTQAFASSMKEDGRSKEARIIYSVRDSFGSRRPIDVIKASRPILILDEPQKMGGAATQTALKKNFEPLFSINYSATHVKKHDLVYVLDALEAFNQKLVKMIEVKGFEVKNIKGIDGYIFFDRIILSPKKPPKVSLEIEINHKNGIKRETRVLGVDDNLYYVSNELEQYRGYTIAEISPENNSLSFTNGKTVYAGDVAGDISERDIRRIQIRETIRSHFEKEEILYKKGIKNLSLFFIDEVANYRRYDENGEAVKGDYAQIFEEEYINILNEYLSLPISNYQKYLREKCADVKSVHNGYFSIDKNGRSINSTVKKNSENISDDISAYDLILKNKERLLSFDEPTRFIFSHSALREGWDNPNIFQICTLKHSDNETGKRQEVGRGMRLCVNSTGTRMDSQNLGDDVHSINLLTVIASESYKDFVASLQDDIKTALYDRPTKATKEYFEGKCVNVGGENIVIDKKQANLIYRYLIKNDYIDESDNVTDNYRNTAVHEPLPDELKPFDEEIHTLIKAVFDDSVLKRLIKDASKPKCENPLNDNFKKKEFQELWKRINHKYAYTVKFESSELIEKAAAAINERLFVSELKYTTTTGRQKNQMNEYEIGRGASFGNVRSKTDTLKTAPTSSLKYDIVGKIASATMLTRRTTAELLKRLTDEKLAMFGNNPEEFINKTVYLINEQKANVIVDHISYNQIEGEYDNDIFVTNKNEEAYQNAYEAKKAIQPYIFTDGISKTDSVERRFAESLDNADEVCVYAKLPKGFSIPTPIGNYSPDWAIAFNEGSVKHIYFIAETKGTMETMELRPIEKAKISCAEKLFNHISTKDVRYKAVDSYETLLDVMNAIK